MNLSTLRQAIDQADTAAALQALRSLWEQAYPATLIASVLSECNPHLDRVYLNLDYVSPALLLAPRLKDALLHCALDPIRIQATHSCDLPVFIRRYLNAVLRGERPLYNGLPQIEIRDYYGLVQGAPVSASQRCEVDALGCLARDSIIDNRAPACFTVLDRWRPSPHDVLLKQPWILIAGLNQSLSPRLAHELRVQDVRRVSNLEEADMLVCDASNRLLSGGAHYFLWNRKDLIPPGFTDLIRGLVQELPRPLLQLYLTRDSACDLMAPLPSRRPALLAISAHWLSRRKPFQVLSFLQHWLAPSRPAFSSRVEPSLIAFRYNHLPPCAFQGVLVIAASIDQVQLHGLDELHRSACRQAVSGGFHQAFVLRLDADVHVQLATLAAGRRGLVFIGPDDEVAPGAWHLIAQRLSWHFDELIFSDEELLWSRDPVRFGQRQFAAPPTPFRLLCQGRLPGLVALAGKHFDTIELQPAYRCLHNFIKDIGLQWLASEKPIHALPHALLRRCLQSNPTLLAISTSNQREPFSADQIRELELITFRHGPAWLVPGGRLEPGPRQGCFQLRYTPAAEARVSVIIPFRDQAALTRICVLSLLEQAGPTPLELVLVDNGSSEAEAIALAAELAPLAAARGIALLGLRDDSPFNFSAINNRARKHCSGTFLLFLNNDIRFESPDPVEALLDPFAMTQTGAVGVRLLYEDGSIQHSGLAAAACQPHDILSPGKGLRPGVETDPFAALELQEQWSAATAACLLMRAADFDRLGGFDESFVVAYNDVDLCWRLSAEGRAVIVTPEPRIIHAESKSRGDDIAGEKRNRLARESGALRQRYPRHFQQGDPLYHRFLGPASHRFEPLALPAKPLAPSRERILYSWVRPQWRKPGERPLLIYVHWDGQGLVRPDVLEQLRAYRSHADLVFVSAAPALLEQGAAMAQLRELSEVVLVRENEGYDFGSWAAGLSFCRRWLDRVPLLILTNDSCYGPLHSVDGIFERLAASRADVVGLTESTAIRSHLQSYFMAYRPRVLRSSLFWAFWEQIGIWETKIDLVRSCEVGWSGVLADAGFQLEALYLAGLHGNVTHTHWRQLLEELQFPFLKTELLRLNPIRQDIDDWQSVAAACDSRVTALIREHLLLSD